MNLLNQKLNEKLLLFNSIDKDTRAEGSLIQTTSTKQPHVRAYNKTENQPTNASTKHYDQLYSNFLGVDKASNQTRRGQFGFEEVKVTTRTDRPKTPSEMNLNQFSRQRSKSKDMSSSNTGERLYNQGFYIKNKIILQRKREEFGLQQQMTPTVLLKSRRLSRSNSSVGNRSIKRRQAAEEEENTSHTPKLNEKSLRIAQHLEPSSVRLMKKKKRKRSIELSEEKRNISTSSTTTKSSKRINELYIKGLETMNKRSNAYKENKRRSEEDYKNYSFRPHILSNSLVLADNIIKNTNEPSKPEIYSKQCNWKNNLIRQNERKKAKMEGEAMTQCTFKPKVRSGHIKNDEQFIMKHVSQINQYVTKRRSVIQKQKEDERYKSKRLGVNSNTPLRPTITKAFNFKTESRSHSREKKVNRNYGSLLSLKPIEPSYPINDYNNAVNDSEMFFKAVNALHCQIESLNI